MAHRESVILPLAHSQIEIVSDIIKSVFGLQHIDSIKNLIFNLVEW